MVRDPRQHRARGPRHLLLCGHGLRACEILQFVIRSGMPADAKRLERAQEIEAAFAVKAGLYLLGSLERGVTVYSQQVRAHNLVWALQVLSTEAGMAVQRVAVVGGGIGGLTATACLLSLFGKAIKLTLFEKRQDLCPLQQGSDTRWLHPHIYNWPAAATKAPEASLPVLNWKAERASRVVDQILQNFQKYVEACTTANSLTFYIGLKHLQIHAASNEISWIGNRGSLTGPFLQAGRSEGLMQKFDVIILAVGFGLEVQPPEYPLNSYWRNEVFSQPILDGTQHAYLISGFGDGALIDLFRLTIERYQQDKIIDEIFQPDLDELEEFLRTGWLEYKPQENTFEFFRSIEETKLGSAIIALSKRLRKDTRVLMHLSGTRGEVKKFSDVFGPYSSFLNKLILFMLYRCGAFHISFSTLSEAVREHGVAAPHILCRYGANVMSHLQQIIVDHETIQARLTAMKEKPEQRPQISWDLDSYTTTG